MFSNIIAASLSVTEKIPEQTCDWLYLLKLKWVGREHKLNARRRSRFRNGRKKPSGNYFWKLPCFRVATSSAHSTIKWDAGPGVT